MTRKKKCVECRYCDMRIDTKNGTRHYCTRRRRVLPANLTPRTACDKFQPPKKSEHWGP
ncbi:MAG: hypothetical protein AAB036_04905 [Elusimicrobiota bacterium]